MHLFEVKCNIFGNMYILEANMYILEANVYILEVNAYISEENLGVVSVILYTKIIFCIQYISTLALLGTITDRQTHHCRHIYLYMLLKLATTNKQYNTIQYNTIQYNTIQYNTIQYMRNKSTSD